MEFLIGCDPEVFVTKNDKFLSAYGLVPGDKENPFKVPYGAVQVDGMALEFNIDPAASEDAFAYNVQEVYNTLCSMVPDYKVVATPVAHFDSEYMKAQPAAALELGCDPDFNAWTGEENKKPNAIRPMRTASGHVHIGWKKPGEIDGQHMSMALVAAKQMDFFLGLPSLFYDKDTLRREMYGKAGCLRYKPYGVEYRTLSNAWLTSEALMRWVYRAAQAGMHNLNSCGTKIIDKYGDIQDIINNSDKKAAMKIIKAEKIEICYG